MLVSRNKNYYQFFVVIGIVIFVLGIIIITVPSFQEIKNLVIQTNKSTYNVDERVFISILNYDKDDVGFLIIQDPFGNTAKKLFFSGRTGIMNYPFFDISTYALECDCNVSGQWKITYESTQGFQYTSIYFWVN